MKFTGVPIKQTKKTVDERLAALEEQVFDQNVHYGSPLHVRYNELVKQLHKLAEHFGLHWRPASSIPTQDAWEPVKKYWWYL